MHIHVACTHLLYPIFTFVMGGVYTVLNVSGVYNAIGGLNSDCRIIFYTRHRILNHLKL